MWLYVGRPKMGALGPTPLGLRVLTSKTRPSTTWITKCGRCQSNVIRTDIPQI